MKQYKHEFDYQKYGESKYSLKFIETIRQEK